MRGYKRNDGLYDIEGHLLDRKGVPLEVDSRRYEPGMPIHDMWVRLVVDRSLVVHDVIAVSDVTPYAVCKEATEVLRRVVGERIAAGWSLMVKSRLGGQTACTHLMEMLIPLGTTAYQTLTHERVAAPDVVDAAGRPVKIDSCYAFASHRSVVRRRWPAFYTGD
jgi:hypothetical protein